MITDSNQVRLTEMTARRLQEGILEKRYEDNAYEYCSGTIRRFKVQRLRGGKRDSNLADENRLLN